MHDFRQVATFIVQKILLDEMGLNYICATAERFFAVRIHIHPSMVIMHFLWSLLDDAFARYVPRAKLYIHSCELRLQAGP